ALRDKDRVWSALPRDRRKGRRAGGGALARRAVPGVARAVLTPEADATIDNRTFVLILQHPQERREPLATAPAILGTLRNAKLVAGLSWPNLARPLGHDADPGAGPCSTWARRGPRPLPTGANSSCSATMASRSPIPNRCCAASTAS